MFDATLSLRRRALDRAALTRLLLRYPATTLRVSARIYGQAVRLKLKGAPYHRHPRTERAVIDRLARALVLPSCAARAAG